MKSKRSSLTPSSESPSVEPMLTRLPCGQNKIDEIFGAKEILRKETWIGKVLDLSPAPRATCKCSIKRLSQSKTLIWTSHRSSAKISMSGEEGAPVQRLHKWLPSLPDRWLFLASQGLSGSCGNSTPFHFIFDDKRKTKRFPGAELTSRVPWAPQEGGGMVSGRGGELGPDFCKFKNHPLAWFSIRFWLLPVILRSCWVPMPGCLRITAQNLPPESEYISFWCCHTKKEQKLYLKFSRNLKSIITTFCSDVSSKAL